MWKTLRLLLSLAVVGLLLAGAVFFVLGIIAVGDGDRPLLLRACVGTLACLGLARLLGRGVGATRLREFDAAVAAHAGTFDPNQLTPAVHCNAGFRHLARRDYPRAVAHFDAALRLDPTSASIVVARVNACGAAGLFGRVVAESTEAIRRDPTDALAYCARATASNGLGRFDHSIPDATEAIRLASHLYLGYDARGYGLLQRGGYTRGIRVLAIVWMVATLGFLRRDRFDLRTPLGSPADFEQAVADFTEAIRLNPAAWDCYDGRARAYRAVGDRARASADEAMIRRVIGR